MSENGKHPALIIAAIVDRWHFDAFHGSCVARDTEMWNFVHRAKEELKRRLSDHMAELIAQDNVKL